MASNEAKVIISAQDNTKAGIKSVQSGFQSFADSAKTFAGPIAGIFAVKAIADFGKASFNAFAEAETSMAKFNTTMGNLQTTGITLVTGQKEVSDGLKLTEQGAKDAQIAIDHQNQTLKQNEDRLTKLNDQLKKNKISVSDYHLSVEALNQSNAEAKNSIDKLNSSLYETNTKTVDVTKTIKFTAQEIENMKTKIVEASKATLKLGFDDEDVAVAMSKFVQQTGSLSDAQKLNTFTMDLARAKGIEYADAGQIVTLALQGQMRGLKDLGFAADDTKTPLENIYNAQKLIAGQAEAFAGTPAGAVQAFSAQWGEVEEAIGGALSDALLPFLQELTKFISDPKFSEYLKITTDAIGIFLKGAIWAVTAAFDGWYQIITSIWEVMKIVATWMKDVFTATLNGIKDAVQAIINTVQALIDAFNRLAVVQSAKSFIGNVIGGAKIVANAITGKATGGPVSGGTPYMVGEAGPELFVPSTSGNIVPNGKLGGGGITINISGNTLLDSNSGDKIAEQIMRKIKGNINI